MIMINIINININIYSLRNLDILLSLKIVLFVEILRSRSDILCFLAKQLSEIYKLML
jgi:hypothetical protein